MIRLYDVVITACYAVIEAASTVAYRLGARRNRLANRRWEARGDLHDCEPF